jgi:pimeloyl-ACP methyl ester carboxylesterase
MMIEAVVQAGAFETSYRRAGRGGTVLLIVAGADHAIGDWLFVALGERFRTIAPDLPRELETAPGLLATWLPALIDGLGLDQPAVVASAAHAHALLRLAARDPHRMGRLVLLHAADGSTAGSGEGLAPDLDGARQHVRAVAVPRAEDHAGRAVTLATIMELLGPPG